MINVNRDIQKIDKTVTGYQSKFWGIRKEDSKVVLVKYDQCFRDEFSGRRYYADNTINEYYSSKLLGKLDIPCIKTEIGFDSHKKRKKCIVIENFLQDNEELIEINENPEEIGENCTYKEFIEKILYKIRKERNVSEFEIENIRKDIVNLSLIDCLIGNYDRFYGNIGIIYDKDNNSYRLSPAYDNARSFQYYYNSTMLDGIFSDYSEYVQKTYEKIINMPKKDLNKIFGLKHRNLRDIINTNKERIKNSYEKCKTNTFKNQLKVDNIETLNITNIPTLNRNVQEEEIIK